MKDRKDIFDILVNISKTSEYMDEKMLACLRVIFQSALSGVDPEEI